jgi:predicted HTH domain antitoxin
MNRPFATKEEIVSMHTDILQYQNLVEFLIQELIDADDETLERIAIYLYQTPAIVSKQQKKLLKEVIKL